MVAAPAMTWSFLAVTAAALVRVLVPVVAPQAYLSSLIAAGALWTMGFVIYLVVYAPILASPRVDGRAG